MLFKDFMENKIIEYFRKKMEESNHKWLEKQEQRMLEYDKINLSSEEIYKLVEKVDEWEDDSSSLEYGFEKEAYRGIINGFRLRVVKRDDGIVFSDICYKIKVFNEKGVEISGTFSFDKESYRRMREVYLKAKQQHMQRVKKKRIEQEQFLRKKRLEEIVLARELLK